LDTVQKIKIWAPQKTLRPPDVPSWLRAWLIVGFIYTGLLLENVKFFLV